MRMQKSLKALNRNKRCLLGLGRGHCFCQWLGGKQLNRETIHSGLSWCVASMVMPGSRVWSQRAYSVPWLSSLSSPSAHLGACAGSPPTGALAGSSSFLA